jgi:hypothetical protein
MMTAADLTFYALPADDRSRVVENISLKIFSVSTLLPARAGRIATTN